MEKIRHETSSSEISHDDATEQATSLIHSTRAWPDTKEASVYTAQHDPSQDAREKGFEAFHDGSRGPAISAWPTQPLPIEGDISTRIFAWLADIALIVISSSLIVKTGLVILAWRPDVAVYVPGTPATSRSVMLATLYNLNAQLITLFTVVFVTIISTLLRRYALYKAQRGSYVSELEQLQGSISAVSTLRLIWSLRAFTSTSAALVVVWTFYYLGSQANKRELTPVNSDNIQVMAIGLRGPNYPSWFYVVPGSNYQSRIALQQTDTSFTTAVVQYHSLFVKRGVGFNGNVIIPDINTILDSKPNSHYDPQLLGHSGWLSVWNQTENYDREWYTSFVGQQAYIYNTSSSDVTRLLSQTLGSYQYPASYFNIRCDTPTQHEYEDFVAGPQDSARVSFNMTPSSSTAATDVFGNTIRSFDYWIRWNAAMDESSYLHDNGSVHMTCGISTTLVDVRVNCVETGCSLVAMRYKDAKPREAVMNYSTAFDNDDFAAAFFDQFARQSATIEAAQTVAALFSRASLFNTTLNDTERESVLTTINPSLRNLINTYYTLSQSVVDVSARIQSLSWDPMTGLDPTLTWVNTTMYGAELNPHYAISWLWIGIDFASGILLLIAAVLSIWLRLHTLVPDIFGYVSSLTRDNVYLKDILPESGSSLTGTERSRIMKNVKVRFGDVSGHDSNVGRIGMTVVKVEGSNITPRQGAGIELRPLKQNMQIV